MLQLVSLLFGLGIAQGLSLNDYGPLEHVLTLQECALIGHIPVNGPKDNELLQAVTKAKKWTAVMLNSTVDDSILTRLHGKICITCFDFELLNEIETKMRWSRPTKILISEEPIDIDIAYEPKLRQTTEIDLNFGAPPFIILRKLYNEIWKASVRCPDVNNSTFHAWQSSKWVTNGNDRLLTCYPAFEGKTLPVSGIGVQPFMLFNPDGSITGTDVQIIELLGEKYGFDIKVTPSFSWYNFTDLDNGTRIHDGATGDVYYGRAIFGIAGLSITPEYSATGDSLLLFQDVR